MDYSNFLMMKEELSLIAVIVVLLLYDLCASKKALRYFQPVACVLVGVHTLLNLVPGAAGEAFGRHVPVHADDERGQEYSEHRNADRADAGRRMGSRASRPFISGASSIS